MTFRSFLSIAVMAMGGLIIPASAQGAASDSPPASWTRTYVFPAFGLAASENGRISVLNVAPASYKGTKASCSGAILFSSAAGKPVGATTTFNDLGTGQIASGDVIGLTPSNPGARNEFQGQVQVTITAGSDAPCSLMMTLEIYDATTNVTHVVITGALEMYAGGPIGGFGRDR